MMKNYNSFFLQSRSAFGTLGSDLIGKNQPAKFSLTKAVWKASLFCTLFLALFVSQASSAQASIYTFAQSNGTYNAITGGTVVTSAMDGSPGLDSYASGSLTIPAFNFAGATYTQMYVTSNGQLSLGATVPSSFTYTVLSSSTGGNIFLAPLSADLKSSTVGAADIRYETIGDEIIVQWTNFQRYGITERISFQVRMNTVTGVVKFVYDGTPPYGSATTYQPQVGIKSADGVYSALTVAAGGNWNLPTNITSGIVAGSIATFSGSVGPTSGLTYTWTPGIAVAPNCAINFAPVNSVVNVARNPILTWQSGGGNATSYDVYFGNTSNPTFIANQIGTSYTPGLLAANTLYYWKIVPKNEVGEAVGCTELSFTTGPNVVYCTPSSTNSSTFISNFSTSFADTNISHVSTYTTGGYQDNYASSSVALAPTSSFNFQMTVTGGTLGAAIWVDWNLSGTFETEERVFVTPSYTSGTISGSVTVPAGTAVGNYRMRVMVDYNSSSPSNPCNTSNVRTETEDYKLTVVPQQVCSGLPAASIISASANSICVSGSITLTAAIPFSSATGLSYQWYDLAGAIPGATQSTYTTPTITTANSYYFRITCANGGLFTNSNTLAIGVNNPQVVTSTSNSRCGEGTVDLLATASAGANLKWYSAATGGPVLGTGTTFTTPSISETTIYYTEAIVEEAPVYVGPASPTAQGGTIASQTTAWNVNFTVSQATELTSVDVFPNTIGQTSAIALRSSTGTVITTVNFTTTVGGGATAQTVILNFPLAPGSYQLYPTLPSGGVMRNTTAASYPYTSSVASITGNGYEPLYFMGIYNWKFASSCSSARTAVTATVDAPPVLTLNNESSTICSGTSSAAVTVTTGASSYDSFVWSPNTGVSGNAIDGYIFNPTSTTTYTLTATQTTGSLCTSDATYLVTVNSLPSAVSILPATAQICAGEVQTLTATGGIHSIEGSSTIGTDATLTAPSTLEPTAFNNRYEHYWMQMVYTQAELNAAGIEAGIISGIKFEITTIGSNTSVSDYKVRIGSTTANVLTSFVTTGLTEVYSVATYSHNVGINSIVFNTPYSWDGVSNIILDVRSTGADSFSNSATYYTATTDNKTATAITANTFTSSDAFAASSPAPTFSLKRLNTTFDWTNNVLTDITWSPTTGLYTDAAATVAYASGNAATVYVKSSIAGEQTYTATATVPTSGCTAMATTTITTTVTDAPTVSAQAFCNSATVASLVANGTGIQWYSALTGGTALVNTAALATGTYYASQTMNSCESARTSVEVVVNVTAAPTASAQVICGEGTVADLVATGTGIQWYSALTGGTALANTAALATGTYYASQTMNSCESTRTSVEVTINTLPAATITRLDDTLTASIENATYQWILCDDASTPIEGANSQSFIATTIGNYAVIVTENGCTAISECFELTTLSNKTFDVAKLGYYPNPVTDMLTITHSDIISSIQIFDIAGRIVKNMKVNSNEVLVDMANMPASVYIVKVFTENNSGEFKVIKK